MSNDEQIHKEEVDRQFKEIFKTETRYCEEMEMEKNEHGVCIFVSKNGKQSINLTMFLRSYRDFLVDEGIVKEKY